MATEWFYGAAGTQAGPHSEEEIRNLISSGTISRETLVWHQGMNDWTAAGKIQQFFGETKPSPQSSSASASANPANPYAVSEASVSGATSAPHSFENYPHFPVKRANFTLHLVVALALPIIATILMVVAVVKAGPTDPAGKLPEEEAMAVGFSFMTAMGLFYVGLIAASVIGYIHLYRAFYCL